MSNASQEAAIQSQISSSQSKKNDADNLMENLRIWFWGQDLQSDKESERGSLLCYNRHR